MATVLGKRKSRTKNYGPSVSEEEARAKLARFFEAQHKPLFSTINSTPAPNTDEEPASDSEASDDDSWDGLSEDDVEEESESSAIEVVAHTDAYSTTTTINKRESRTWLSSRPPIPTSAEDTPSSTDKKGNATKEEDAPSLLKNDLELQRLLAESHLFSAAAAKTGDTGEASTEHVGRYRHLATDLRLSALGSKTSIYKQVKMPMSFRKGIQSVAAGKESKRRREARENGIVLERPGASNLSKKASKEKRKGSSRAIDAPAVGRMSNGMLRLSKQDIASIEDSGPRRRGGFDKKGRLR
jgi:hypothetical protein